MEIDEVRARLLAMVAGALAMSCGPSLDSTAGDGSSDGGSAGPTGGGPGSSTSTTSDIDQDGDGGVTGGVPVFDVGIPDVEIDPPPPRCPPQPDPPIETCDAALPVDAFFQFFCVEPREGDTCDAWANAYVPELEEWIGDCVETRSDCEATRVGAIGCGPLPDTGERCCFWFIATEQLICPGRPFVVGGKERLPSLHDRADWADDVTIAPAPELHRQRIAAAWAEQARFEHASIASFSRFMLQLLACGAPSDLVADAALALREEIDHARLFFGFASFYAARPIGPGPLDTQDALESGDGFEATVLGAVREGCIAETISAWHARFAARSAGDPVLARVLARVAEEELRHAALAWRFLAWAMPRCSDSLHREVRAALRTPARFAPRGLALDDRLPPRAWLAHGILPPPVHAVQTELALHHLVEPLGRALIGGPGRDRRSSAVASHGTRPAHTR